jgi:putative molybdopterin biosynthesis protein
MDSIRNIGSFNVLKILSDPRRMTITRMLMKSPATLSQLGRSLGMSPARVRHHLIKLMDADLVELVQERSIGGFIEKYYRATSKGFFINAAVLPEQAKQGTIYLIGSHDPALEILSEILDQDKSIPNLVTLPVGSMDGLVALRQGLCRITGCHLFDQVESSYNSSYVRHFFPGQPMRIITLAHREQGLLVAPGNPLKINELNDLQREDITFINRKFGSGTRIRLDQQIQVLGIEISQIRGYKREVNTHSQVAEALISGTADVGLAVLAAAQRLNLSFIPLFEERFDLVIPEQTYKDPIFSPLFNNLNDTFFREKINSLVGYRSTDTGKELQI